MSDINPSYSNFIINKFNNSVNKPSAGGSLADVNAFFKILFPSQSKLSAASMRRTSEGLGEPGKDEFVINLKLNLVINK